MSEIKRKKTYYLTDFVKQKIKEGIEVICVYPIKKLSAGAVACPKCDHGYSEKGINLMIRRGCEKCGCVLITEKELADIKRGDR